MKPDSIPHNPNTHRPLTGLDPRDISVVMVAHGDLGGPGMGSNSNRNQALERHRAHLATNGRFLNVTAGVLKGTPTLEDALGKATASNPKAIALYPFFMSDGYFVKKILPQRLADCNLTHPHHCLQPLGLEPNLVNLIVTQAITCARNAHIEAMQARLLLVGHGSKFGPASANATRAAAQRLESEHANAFAQVEVAFLEEKPFLGDQLTASKRATLVSGFFNGDGLHAGEDVPAALEDAVGNGSHAVYAGPIGAAPEVSDIIQTAILSAITPPDA